MSSSARPPGGRSTLARSKSLRLPRPTAAPQSKDDSSQPEGSCQLRRHGSMRIIGGPGAVSMSASYHGSLQQPEPQPTRKPQAPSLPTRRARPEHPRVPAPTNGGAIGGSLPARHSPDEEEKSLAWKEHFARLVQEHDRLQVKYGRLRAHVVERECRQQQQAKSGGGGGGGGGGGPLLAPIPEDEADSPDGELPPCVRESPLLLGLHLEAQRLQHDLRRAQRAYWDLVLGNDPGDDSAEVVVNLLAQLEKKDTELCRARGRGERLSESLAQSEREVAACRDALHDYQLQMEAQRDAHDALKARIHDLQVQLGEAREGCEFLQAERTTLAEAQCEAEAEIRRLRGLLEAALETSRILYQRCSKLFAKCQQKSARLCQLESQLESQRPSPEASSGQAALVAQLSAKLQAFLKTSVLFAASHLQLDSEVLDEIMDDLEGSGDERSSSSSSSAAPSAESVVPRKDPSRLPPLVLAEGGGTTFANGDSEPNSSYGTPVDDELPPTGIPPATEHSSLVRAVLQAAAEGASRNTNGVEGGENVERPPLVAMRPTVNGGEISEKLAERRNTCVVERTLVECNGTRGGGDLEGPVLLPVSVSEEPNEPRHQPGGSGSSRANGFHVADVPTFSRQSSHCLANGVGSGVVSGSSSSESNLLNGGCASGHDEDAAAQSCVIGKPVGTVPPFRTVTDGGGSGKSAGVTGTAGGNSAGSSGQERSLAELASLSGKLVRILSLMQARVQERLRTDHEQIEELKQNLDTVCLQKAQCGLETGELRRQRDQACERAQRLEQQMAALQDGHTREVELLFQQMGDLKEKNRCLVAVNEEQSRQLAEELQRVRGGGCFSAEADALCAKLRLRQELERSREELLLKDEQLRALAAKFGRFRKAYEDNYQRATDDIDKLDTMLERVIETLEGESEVVSSCPALAQLLHNLRGGPGEGESAPPPPQPPAPPTNRRAPTAL
ncbi:uncharacterized protein LOC144146961 isoform X2 [Haemaphysalis longicornis]